MSVGLGVLGGIVAFLCVEKLVRIMKVGSALAGKLMFPGLKKHVLAGRSQAFSQRSCSCSGGKETRATQEKESQRK